MNEEEKKQLEEARERLIKDALWSIAYHEQKLKEAELALLVLNNSKPY